MRRLVGLPLALAAGLFAALSLVSTRRPLAQISLATTSAHVLYVSPDGADGPSRGQSRDAPLKSVTYARDLLRSRTPGASATVVLLRGTHYLAPGEPLSLGPEDSNTRFVGEGATLSAGRSIPAACFEREGTSDIWACRLDDAGGGAPRVARIDARTSLPARAPNEAKGRPYESGWLYVDQVLVSGGDFAVFTVDTAAPETPAFLEDDGWAGGRATMFPRDSWHSYQGLIRNADGASYTQSSRQRVLNMTCPVAGACDADDTEIKAGCRFYVYATPDGLSEGEWYLDEARRTLRVWPPRASATFDVEVVLPTAGAVVEVSGADFAEGYPATPATSIVLESITFADASYWRHGFQNGFSQRPDALGFPDDAAVRISGGRDVAVRNCTFRELGGGGVAVGNGSAGVAIAGNVFERLGQSAVIFVGNATSQATDSEILDNRMTDIGTIHGSAGGVVLSSASRIRVARNDISKIARWGVHVRHFAPESVGGPSLANVVEHNRVVETGETTAALGAISTTGVWHNAGLTNSVIRYNCVRDTIGFDKGNARPDETFGIYLDNEASGYDVHHNVIRNTQDGGFMVHYGHNNTVWNNVFANASLSGYDTTGGGVWADGDAAYNTTGNTFWRNVLVVYNNSGEMPPRLLKGEMYAPYYSTIDDNVYFSPDLDLAAWNSSELTPLGTWAQWTAAGYDARSKVADPMFRDVAEGDFCLLPDSPAFDLGFDPIPFSVCQC